MFIYEALITDENKFRFKRIVVANKPVQVIEEMEREFVGKLKIRVVPLVKMK